MTRRTLLLSLAVPALAAPVAAAEPEPDDARRAEEALAATVAQSARTEIIVIGSPERLADISGAGAVVRESDLLRSRVLTVNEALRQVAGVFPREEEGLGARPNIGIRGLNPTRSTKVLLLEDGIPLSYAPYGDNASYYHPPIERFTRVEVLKGSSQIRFGPQTVGGVVNYITPSAPATLAGRLSLSGGNLGSYLADAQVGGPLLGGRALLHVNRKASDGARENQRLRFTDLFAKAEWDVSDRHALTLKASYFQEDSDVTYSGLTRAEFAAEPRQNPFVNDRFDTHRWNLTVAHAWTIGDGINLQTTGYYHHFGRDWWRQSSNSLQRPNDASDPQCGGMANLLTTCGNEGRLRVYDTWGIETRLTLDHARLFGGAIGGGTEMGLRYHSERQKRRQWNGDTPTARTPGTSVNAGVRENNERDADAFSLFVHSRMEFGRLAIQPGVRAEFIDYARRNLAVDILVGGRPSGNTTVPSSGSTALDRVIPGVGVTFALADAIVLYGGAHRGFAPPRVEDILTTTGGTVDLEPELSWNYEAGVRGTLAPGLTLDATWFRMDFANQIVPQSVAGGVGATLTSAGRTRHEGGELSLAWNPESPLFARTAIAWLPTARYASTRIATPPCFDGRTPGAPVETRRGFVPCGLARDVEGNRLPYAPELLVSAAAGATIGRLTGQFEVVGQTKMYGDDVNLVPVSPDGQRGLLPGYALVNLALNWVSADERLELFATVKNLAGRTVIVDRARGALPGMPRWVMAGATLRF
ncbi:TonB-dependent receptor family protein [Thermaurantiacus sp.]